MNLAAMPVHVAAACRRGVLAGLAALAVVLPPAVDFASRGQTDVAAGAALTTASPPSPVRLADFGSEHPPADVRYLADWVADSGDNAGVGFVLVDKRLARVYVFDAEASLLGSSPILVGSAIGDETVPGIGTRPIDHVLPSERTTPAGRFVAERGRNARGEDVVWVDYDAAVSMHRVLTTHPKERRLQRLASPAVDDNRVSYGCINVPVDFYERLVRPGFATHRAVVYVLPEQRDLAELFGAYDVRTRQSLHLGAANSARRDR